MTNPIPQVLIAFGSFNPITVMHLRMFEIAKHHLLTKKNIIVEKGVITPVNDLYARLKPSLSPSRHRLAMIRLALNDIKWIVCEPWETEQKERVLTLPALKYYETKYGKNITLLCGSDLLESFLIPGLWADDHIEEILRCYGVVCVPREGSNPWKLIHDSSKAHMFKKYLDNIEIVDDFYSMNISSTIVRESVKQGKPIDHLVHKAVANYILTNGLYKY